MENKELLFAAYYSHEINLKFNCIPMRINAKKTH